MKKIIRLTESDLTRIVKKSIIESGSPYDDWEREQMFNEPTKKLDEQEELVKMWNRIVTLMEDFIELEKSFEPDDKAIKMEFSKFSSTFKKTLEVLDPDPR